jgi:glycosyltransferase involved in cell wall biosynthesis
VTIRISKSAPNNKTRILHVITGLSTGGAETMLLKLLTNMDKDRFENVVVSLTTDGELAADIRELGISLQSLGMRRGLPAIRSFFHLVKILRKERPDVVQTWLYHSDLAGFLASRIAGNAKVCWNLRCSFMGEDYYQGLRGLVFKILAWLSRRSDGIVVNSQAGKELHQNLGYSSSNWQLLPNGFDTNKFKPDPDARTRLRDMLNISNVAPIIGLVGRFDPVKGHDIFFDAARQLIGTHPDTHFLLAGGGCIADNPDLTAMIPDSVRGKVHLLGARKDIPQITAALDIANCVSIGEGFPNIVGEAMSCGTPCVVTDAGDCASIVGDTGKVIPVNDAAALTEAWRDFLGMPSVVIQELCEKSRERIKINYSIEAITNQYQEFYESLCQE